ncbi:uncharacterized protein SAMN05428642_103412 [Flaviramulus basaltis]|uniref:DUF418 domain-containing protein n=1 Tax=Flaviramulus basaltis TaxID=369401 RepID=A0A1K2INZ1_9FLAO|nr:DUF418 domain-containing protein [Flaviramulus basaltis]SFZ93912.1 uncharacterized protein SAMN05428642_103412 [Flaviramulus basaltis]
MVISTSKDIGGRMHVVDALRGFAIVSIMLLHNIQHFSVEFSPENLPNWLEKLDEIILKGSFFVFGGKSYAIFALLFGLTFFIQLNNKEKKDEDFRFIFAWRLVLLFVFGIINSVFYSGDILIIYAVIGFLLIPVARLSDNVVLCIALFLFIQPIEMISLVQVSQNSNKVLVNSDSWSHFKGMGEYLKDESFINTVKGNLTNGKVNLLKWSNENARFLHVLSLFMFGMLTGRKHLFKKSLENNRFWLNGLIISSIVFVPLYIFQKNIDFIFARESMRHSISTIIRSWTNISFMIILVSGFVLLFQKKKWNKILSILSPMGKMSLSNYIFQSIIGATLYYGFGLGLYKYTGATYSALISILLSIIMGYFSFWWMKNNKRGPLENIWHKATWMFSSAKKAKEDIV